jgi:hypothetical protein
METLTLLDSVELFPICAQTMEEIQNKEMSTFVLPAGGSLQIRVEKYGRDESPYPASGVICVLRGVWRISILA